MAVANLPCQRTERFFGFDPPFAYSGDAGIVSGCAEYLGWWSIIII